MIYPSIAWWFSWPQDPLRPSDSGTGQDILAEAWSEQILPGWPPMVAETQLDSPLVIYIIGWFNLKALRWCFILPIGRIKHHLRALRLNQPICLRIHSWGIWNVGMFLWFLGAFQQIQNSSNRILDHTHVENTGGLRWFWAAPGSNPSPTARTSVDPFLSELAIFSWSKSSLFGQVHVFPYC